MTEIEVTISSEYGLMFLYDGKTHPDFPENAGAISVTFTESCIAFTVLGYVDGDAKIIITDNISDYKGGFKLFEGRIACPSKILSLFDPNAFCFVSVPLKSEYADFILIMSEQSNADSVRCIVSNMASF